MAKVSRTQKRIKPPKSSATNAYDLLADVCRVILKEPKRYTQHIWGTTSESEIEYQLDTHDKTPPACGTMACRAGWLVQLRDGRMPLDQTEIAARAYRILGHRPGTFSPYGADIGALFDASAVRGRVGTMAYAKKGAGGIRRFMAKHKARLKAIRFAKATAHA